MSVREKNDERLRDMAALDALFLEAAETERKLPPAIRKQKDVKLGGSTLEHGKVMAGMISHRRYQKLHQSKSHDLIWLWTYLTIRTWMSRTND